MQEKQEVEQDKGIEALMATGLVPEGYVFKTNATPKSMAGKTHTHTSESLKADYEASGFDVIVLKGKAFDINGRNYNGDAIVVKKRETASV